jgi:hypothetical protein
LEVCFGSVETLTLAIFTDELVASEKCKLDLGAVVQNFSTHRATYYDSEYNTRRLDGTAGHTNGNMTAGLGLID